MIYALIPLRARDGSIRAWAKVDADVAPELTRYRWHLHSAGYAARRATRSERNSYILLMHRAVVDPPDGMEVDHINGDHLDNRRSNLRVATKAENAQNRHNLPSRGVSWDPRRKKWQARVRLNHRTYHLGRFERREDAVNAVQTFRREHMPFSEADKEMAA